MKLLGRKDLFRPEVTARLATEISGPKDRLQFARVLVKRGPGGWVAESTGGGSSNLISTVARANGLAMIPAGQETAPVGSEVRVMVFRSMGS